MSHFIVRVTSFLLDEYGIERSHIADSFVPVDAPDETEACKRAVLWHGDNGVAVEDQDLLWKCNDPGRGVLFKATRCLGVSADELEQFLCVTQGLTTATVIGRAPK
jgi:hypothetical protein